MLDENADLESISSDSGYEIPFHYSKKIDGTFDKRKYHP